MATTSRRTCEARTTHKILPTGDNNNDIGAKLGFVVKNEVGAHGKSYNINDVIIGFSTKKNAGHVPEMEWQKEDKGRMMDGINVVKVMDDKENVGAHTNIYIYIYIWQRGNPEDEDIGSWSTQ